MMKLKTFIAIIAVVLPTLVSAAPSTTQPAASGIDWSTLNSGTCANSVALNASGLPILASCGNGNFNGPGSSTANDIIVFSDATGKNGADSGVPYNAIPAANSNFTAPGTGGQTVSLQAHLQYLGLTANDFGAACNGSTNDATAFQNLINEVSSLGVSGTWAGNCYISTTLTTGSTYVTKLIGNGAYNSVLTFPAGTNGFTLGQAAVDFEDFELQWTSSSGETALSIYPSGSSENTLSLFQNLLITGPANCFNFVRASNWTSLNNRCFFTTGSGYQIQNQNNVDSGDSSIIGGLAWATGAGQNGILYESSGGLKINGFKVNVAGGTLSNCINLALASGATTGVFTSAGASYENCSQGVSFSRQGSTGSFTGVVFSGNEFQVTNYAFYEPTDANGSWLKSVALNGNVINLTGSSGGPAGYAFVTTVQGLNISGGNVNNVGTTGATRVYIPATETATECSVGPITASGNAVAASTIGSCTGVGTY